MKDHHDLIVRRVITALDESSDPDTLVAQYFDQDRDAVIQATQQTLEATREDASVERVAAAVDRELIEALRFPPTRLGGRLASLYIHRRAAGTMTTLTLLAALLGFLLL